MLSDEDREAIINAHTREGRVIKTRIRPILQKYRIPYTKLDNMLNQVSVFIEKTCTEFESMADSIANKFIHMNEELRNNLRIFCFAESPFINTMWAYYSNNNNGFCIEYDLQKAMAFDTNTKRLLLQIFKIKYIKNKQKFSFSTLIEKVLLGENIDEQDNLSINAKILDQLLTKEIDWKHEKEWRIIVQSNLNCLNIDLVSGIYVDFAMLNDANALRLVNLAKDRNWKIYTRRMNMSQTKYVYDEI